MATTSIPSPTEEYRAGSEKSQALSGCDRDAFLRRWGFTIERRPRRGPVLWLDVQSGMKRAEAEAVRIAQERCQKSLRTLACKGK